MTSQWDLATATLASTADHRTTLRGPYRRLVDTWFSSHDGQAIAGDLGALLGQVLRHRRGVTGQGNHSLVLSLNDRGVPEGSLRKAHLRVTRFGLDQHRIGLGDAWAPPWLRGDPRWVDVASTSPDSFMGPDGLISTSARHNIAVTVDPAVGTIAGVEAYRSRTQASALRAAALAVPDSTVHVVLPTGTGKSLVGVAPGLLKNSGVTVVVVPTVALALDQERQTRMRFAQQPLPAELAYYSDRPESEREAIKTRLRDGTQKVLFASPEAVVTGLAHALRQLASRGQISHIVVDEAHLVRSWGLSFRPDFQVLASLVSELRDIARARDVDPPRVVMLTATLSPQSLLLNDELFAGSSPSLFVGSTFLRSELRYFLAPPVAETHRLDRVVDAVRHLPRPAIVYTTKREAADQIAARLREEGFGRTAVFHGDVQSDERSRILRSWSGDGEPTSIDVVVGTSAFGLGVDQSDVRTVIHACVPASVDRFYQEVGRGGRDGHAALSVWLPSTTDEQEGRRIENATVLGDAKSWGRWQAMRTAQRTADPTRREMVLDTSTVPPWLTHASDSNRLWNRNTLVLLQRAGLLDIIDTPPPALERQPDEPEARWTARLETAWTEYAKLATVRIRPGVGNVSESTVSQAIETVRSGIRDAEASSRRRIERLFALKECWGSVLSEEYEYAAIGAMHANQVVAPACSGCPAEGHAALPSLRAAQPTVSEASLPDLQRSVSSTLKEMSNGSRTLVVTYPEGGLRLHLPELVTKSVTHGIRGILASASLAATPAVIGASRSAQEGLVTLDPIVARPPTPISVPTLILLDPADPPRLTWLRGEKGALRIVVVPEGTPDPEYPDQAVKNIRVPHWSLSYFLRSL
ncbi:protein DpdF [Krasilnikoviella flava]|uniref:Helicase conserved C-terminal domain-containing protein n=1 Tax=Krasilnikoviella flava TaxID=526729 RepID=A0A1T5KSY0_9MICO|nr:protein DpdF [Krasilnikoviella flava]SKC66499.1 Helicase conserved C-terminal domain-containing protein [Krasilnikoviella flava]